MFDGDLLFKIFWLMGWLGKKYEWFSFILLYKYLQYSKSIWTIKLKLWNYLKKILVWESHFLVKNVFFGEPGN